MSTDIIPVESHDFYGQQIALISDEGEDYALLDQLCSHMSIDREPQRKKIARQAWAKGMTSVMEVMLPGETRNYPRTVINVKIIGMWLANIATSRMKDPHARQMVERYQIELTEKIHEWLRGHNTHTAQPALPQDYLSALKQLVASEEARQIAEARADTALAKVDAFENAHGQVVTDFASKYFPDNTRNQLFAFFYAKEWLVNDSQGRWSEKRKKHVPGPRHQTPIGGGKRYFYCPEEEDSKGNVWRRLRVRRDTEHELVQVLEQNGFRPVLASTFDTVMEAI